MYEYTKLWAPNWVTFGAESNGHLNNQFCASESSGDAKSMDHLNILNPLIQNDSKTKSNLSFKSRFLSRYRVLGGDRLCGGAEERETHGRNGGSLQERRLFCFFSR